MKKSILITGSTDGIGKLAAIKLAKEGHEIYLHGRNVQKLNNTISEVKELSGNLNIRGFAGDFSDLESVQKMINQLQNDLPKLDVLINNAGIFKTTQSKNKDGFDVRMVVNYLAPYLLTKELIPLLQKGNQPRIVNLSSAAQAPVSMSSLSNEAILDTQQAYAQSKLALTMWSFDLAKKEPSISTIAVNPGSLLNTKMAIEAYGQHWSSAGKGANLLHDLATSSEFEGVTEKYFDNDLGDPRGAFGKAHTDAYNQEKIDRLMTETEKVLVNL
ncbi:MAG: SDR family NAD(P)-dependent oxidoreductase [Flavobacteriaceae bacterium]